MRTTVSSDHGCPDAAFGLRISAALRYAFRGTDWLLVTLIATMQFNPVVCSPISRQAPGLDKSLVLLRKEESDTYKAEASSILRSVPDNCRQTATQFYKQHKDEWGVPHTANTMQ
jgi:hypothetical protein